MSRIVAPKGWRPDKIEYRFLPTTPLSYNAADHSCECVVSAGSAVMRVYGKEILGISRSAIDLSRVPCPLLDSHNQTSVDNILGRIDSAWIDNGKLCGRIVFAQTARGMAAEGMVSRGELTGMSAGYSVQGWRVTDSDGDVLDPDKDHISWDVDLTFVATKWQLAEGSLVGCPADPLSAIRSHGGNSAADDARRRMQNRQAVAECRDRMQIRQAMLDQQQSVSESH
jgi:phage head maturation protease